MSHDPGLKFQKFLFSPNSVLNFGKSYQIWEKLALEQKCYRLKNKLGGGKGLKWGKNLFNFVFAVLATNWIVFGWTQPWCDVKTKGLTVKPYYVFPGTIQWINKSYCGHTAPQV